MQRLVSLLICVFSFATAYADDAAPAIQPVEPQLGRPVDFNLDVFPVLEAKCLACHNRSTAESDMVLETVEDILEGGISGQVVVPGQPDESLLYLLAARADVPEMPPLPNGVGAKPLTPEELGLLRTWITEGAHPGQAAPADSTLAWQPVPSSIQSIFSVALSPDERYIAAGRANRVVIYDLPLQREVTQLTDPALLSVMHEGRRMYGPGESHRDFVHAVAFSPDGNLLASAGYRVVKLWERQRNVQLAKLQADSPARRLAVNADGTRAATVHADNTVRLWNLATGQSGATLPAHPGQVHDAAFHPDSEIVVTGCEDGIVRTWNGDSGEPVTELVTPSPVRALACNADGSQVITGHADNVIRVWAFPTAEEDPAEDEPAEQAAEGDEAADEEAAAETPPQPLREIRGHGRPITALVLLRATGEVLSGSEDNTVRIWKLENGQQIFSQNLGGRINAVAATSDGQLVAGAGENGLVRIWQRNGRQQVEIKGDPALDADVIALTDAQTVAQQRRSLAEAAANAAEQDVTSREEALTQATEQKQQAEQALTEAQAKVSEAEAALKAAEDALAADPENGDLKNKRDEAQNALNSAQEARDQAQAALDSAQRAVALSEEALANSKQRRDEAQTRHEAEQQSATQAEMALAAAREAAGQNQQPARAVAFSADGKQLATGAADGRLHLWDVASGRHLETFEGHTAAVAGLAFLQNGSLVSAAEDQTTIVWETGPGWNLVARLGANPDQPLDVSESPFADRVLCLDFSPDGALLATGGGEPSRSGELLLWNVAERRVQREFPDAHSDTVFDVEFSWDGERLASGGADKFMKVHDVATGELVRSYEGHTEHVLAVAWKADGGTLASGGADNAIKLWTAATGEQRRTITTHSKQVTDVDFVGAADILVSSSGDQTVRTFNGNNGSPRRSFGGSQDFVYSVTTGRDESYVIGGGEDGVLRVWNGANGRLLFSFEPPAPETETAAVN